MEGTQKKLLCLLTRSFFNFLVVIITVNEKGSMEIFLTFGVCLLQQKRNLVL